jgi:glycosyltransferase involved in cell wall biosynthesis
MTGLPAGAPTVAVCFRRLGPYHHARLRAAGARCRLFAIEFSAQDDLYAWTKVEGAQGFEKLTLFDDADANTKRGGEIRRRVRAALTRVAPDVVLVPGWSQRGALAAIEWSLEARRPAVMMSESTLRDADRSQHREAIKRRIVSICRAALVGGGPQREYVCRLGQPAEKVFDGYDVVDNQHFAAGAESVRADAPGWRRKLGLPERFFLASGRFVDKKNLLRLIEAFGSYRRRHSGESPWSLVLLGAGGMRARILERIAALGLDGQVLLPGFRQYDELPSYYGLAGAFIHASTAEQWGLVVNEAMAAGLPVIVSERCGCAPDLVRSDVNGYVFDPSDSEALAGLMARVAADDHDRRAAGQASRAIIADWDIDRFAGGLMNAVEVALRASPPRASWLDRALLWMLVHR